jgi:hypothetical protein
MSTSRSGRPLGRFERRLQAFESQAGLGLHGLTREHRVHMAERLGGKLHAR